MEAVLHEPLTYPSEDFAKSWFQSYPRDSRFLNCSLQKFMPTSSKDANVIIFECARFEAPNCYMIQEAILEVQIAILKADGKVPTKDKNVAPVNNVLHSLFESVKIFINDKNIVGSPSAYPYKSYISTVLTYSTIVKGSQLQSQGFYPDLSGHYDDIVDNSGFISRNLLFRKNNATGADYREEGATFIGRIFHDLSSCESGLPPGVKVKFELERSKDEFFLMKQSSDNEKYKVKIININLLMPIAQLTQGVFNEYNTILTRQIDNKPVGISFRKIAIRPLNIPRNSETFYSEVLFTDDMPLRIIICFVESNRRTGDYSLNPFRFDRKWTWNVSSVSNVPSTTSSELSEIQRRLQESEEINRQLLTELQSLIRGKGPKRGKRSKPVRTDPQTDPVAGPSRFVQYSSRSQFDNVSVTSDESSSVGNLGATKTVFLKKAELILNGQSIDGLEGN